MTTTLNKASEDNIVSETPETPEIQADTDILTPDTSVEAETASPTAASQNDDTVVITRVTLNYIVIAVMFFAVGLLIGAISFRSTATIDEAAIEAAVQNVLVDAGMMQPPGDMDVLVDDDPYLGPEDAPIVIVEFSAYACPYCGRHFEETLEPLLENYGQYIRYVYRDMPIINQAVSIPASLAANCALEQGQFWEYHNAIFANQNALAQSGQPYLIQLAAELGLDAESFTTCLTEQQYMDEVIADANTGSALGITGTPAFYINGAPHNGARPYEYFETIILRELSAAGIDY